MSLNIHRAYGGFAAELSNLCSIMGSHVEDYEVFCYPQTWPSTALGFGGTAGQAFTSSVTFVAINEWDYSPHAMVVVGVSTAYVVLTPTRDFRELVLQHHTPGMVDAKEEELGDHVFKFENNSGWWDLRNFMRQRKEEAAND